MEGEEHFAGLRGGDSTTYEPSENHRQRLLNGSGIAQGIRDLLPESRPGADGWPAGAAKLFMAVAVGAGASGRGLGDSSVGLRVAAEWILGTPGFHQVPFAA